MKVSFDQLLEHGIIIETPNLSGYREFQIHDSYHLKDRKSNRNIQLFHIRGSEPLYIVFGSLRRLISRSELLDIQVFMEISNLN